MINTFIKEIYLNYFISARAILGFIILPFIVHLIFVVCFFLEFILSIYLIPLLTLYCQLFIHLKIKNQPKFTAKVTFILLTIKSFNLYIDNVKTHKLPSTKKTSMPYSLDLALNFVKS